MTKPLKILLWIVIAGFILFGCWVTATSQEVLSRRTAAGEEVALSFVSQALETGQAVTKDTATITLTDRDNKFLGVNIHAGNFGTVSLTSVKCLETDSSAVLIDSSASVSLTTYGYYFNDADLPTSGTCRIEVTYGSSMYASVGLLFYAGIHQTSPVDSLGENDNCGGATSTASSGATTMRWDWTTNACVAQIAYRLNGKTSGTVRLDAMTTYEDAASLTVYTGQTEFYSDETISVVHAGSSRK